MDIMSNDKKDAEDWNLAPQAKPMADVLNKSCDYCYQIPSNQEPSVRAPLCETRAVRSSSSLNSNDLDKQLSISPSIGVTLADWEGFENYEAIQDDLEKNALARIREIASSAIADDYGNEPFLSFDVSAVNNGNDDESNEVLDVADHLLETGSLKEEPLVQEHAESDHLSPADFYNAQDQPSLSFESQQHAHVPHTGLLHQHDFHSIQDNQSEDFASSNYRPKHEASENLSRKLVSLRISGSGKGTIFSSDEVHPAQRTVTEREMSDQGQKKNTGLKRLFSVSSGHTKSKLVLQTGSHAGHDETGDSECVVNRSDSKRPNEHQPANASANRLIKMFSSKPGIKISHAKSMPGVAMHMALSEFGEHEPFDIKEQEERERARLEFLAQGADKTGQEAMAVSGDDVLLSQTSVSLSSMSSVIQPHFPPGYDPRIARMLIDYSTAAYCRIHRHSTLSECHCLTISVPDFTLVKDVRNEKTFAHGFVGYSFYKDAMIVAFRGTASIGNWIKNLQFGKDMTEFLKEKGMPKGALVHSGFLGLYNSIRDEMMNAFVKLYKVEQGMAQNHIDIMKTWNVTKHVQWACYVTGHSLGGALAQLFALDAKLTYGIDCIGYSYGQPRVGNRKFASFFNSHVPQFFRLVNSSDIVPHMPLRKLGYYHAGHEVWYKSKSSKSVRKIVAKPDGKKTASVDVIDPDKDMPEQGCAGDTLALRSLNIVDHKLYYDRLTGRKKLRGEKPPPYPTYVDGLLKVVAETFNDFVTRQERKTILVFVGSFFCPVCSIVRPKLGKVNTYLKQHGLDTEMEIVMIDGTKNDLPDYFSYQWYPSSIIKPKGHVGRKAQLLDEGEINTEHVIADANTDHDDLASCDVDESSAGDLGKQTIVVHDDSVNRSYHSIEYEPESAAEIAPESVPFEFHIKSLDITSLLETFFETAGVAFPAELRQKQA